jgi:hypothetical protein
MSRKKDDDSWSYGGVKRRDFRNSHDGPEVVGKHKKKKDKRKCKKNKDGPHEPELVEESHGWYKIYKCIHCGKHLDYDFGRDFFDTGKS